MEFVVPTVPPWVHIMSLHVPHYSRVPQYISGPKEHTSAAMARYSSPLDKEQFIPHVHHGFSRVVVQVLGQSLCPPDDAHMGSAAQACQCTNRHSDIALRTGATGACAAWEEPLVLNVSRVSYCSVRSRPSTDGIWSLRGEAEGEAEG